MNSKTYLSSIAKNDIKLIIRRFNSENPVKGEQFLEELKKVLLIISENPLEKVLVYDEIRIYPLEKFSINIHYHYTEVDHKTYITAVFPFK